MPQFTIPGITDEQIPDIPIIGAQKLRMKLQGKMYILHCLKTELPIGWNPVFYEYSCL